MSAGLTDTPWIDRLRAGQGGVERLGPDERRPGDHGDDRVVVGELLAALLALFLGVGDVAGHDLERVAADAAGLLVDVLDGVVDAVDVGVADLDRATLLVEVADLDRLEAAVGRARPADVGGEVGDLALDLVGRRRRLGGRVGRGGRLLAGGLGRRSRLLGRALRSVAVVASAVASAVGSAVASAVGSSASSSSSPHAAATRANDGECGGYGESAASPYARRSINHGQYPLMCVGLPRAARQLNPPELNTWDRSSAKNPRWIVHCQTPGRRARVCGWCLAFASDRQALRSPAANGAAGSRCCRADHTRGRPGAQYCRRSWRPKPGRTSRSRPGRPRSTAAATCS